MLALGQNETQTTSGDLILQDTIPIQFLSMDQKFTTAAEQQKSNVVKYEFPYTTESFRMDDETYIIVDGDLLLTKTEYLRLKAVTQQKKMVSAKAVVRTKEGKPVKWNEPLPIRFGVFKSAFTSAQEYELVRNSLKTAAEDWMAVCGIEFEFNDKYDLERTPSRYKQPPPGFSFMVKAANLPPGYLAMAFYPDSGTSMRFLLVDHDFFKDGVNHVGVMRHELGHVMGFLHELDHPDAPKGCYNRKEVFKEAFNLEYDPTSIMHYFCTTADGKSYGSEKLVISKKDSIVANVLYPN
jgi:hypothetical protein